jgi:uncharacterized membrane protein
VIPLTREDLQNKFFEAFYPHNIAKDLLFFTIWLLAAILTIYIPLLNESLLRVIFSIPIILFIPGYVLIAALFPGNDDLEGIERVALSFGLSIAVVPLIGLMLNYTSWGIRLDPIVISLVIFTAVMAMIAQYRRSLLPDDERFRVLFRTMLHNIRSALFSPGQSHFDRVLSVILIIAIVTAIATTIYVIAVTKEREKYTEFYILGPGGKAADFPTRFAAGEPQNVTIGIGNHEYRTVNYTVETVLLSISFNQETNVSFIDTFQILDRWAISLPHNETLEVPYTFMVDDIDNNRLEFLLFNEKVPSETVTGMNRISASYRDLNLWITVM